MTDISDDSISNQFFSFSDHTLPYVVNYQMKANRNAQVIVNIIDDFCEVKIRLNNKAGERYARSHGPFGCTPRPSSEVSRTSLLGRPIKPGPHRHHDPRYRKSQSFVYNFLERPRGWKAFVYHLCM
ncbi:Potassium voltage-gated channel sub KQT member 4 [Dermatophagoides farinae]|uniref:Potassium voltage-gated channel sub KQT member 4 n=1 Tax=Dermatophagoides farinae TaxID=6954 RepID=A0A922L8C1_DERFA|nr:Potassium voltage-gated channel sub KQT member 4 [Dermatophagoides farinae]